MCCSSQEEHVLKRLEIIPGETLRGCSSQEEHVLKRYSYSHSLLLFLLLLARGACIETSDFLIKKFATALLLARGACIETSDFLIKKFATALLLARGACIETRACVALPLCK